MTMLWLDDLRPAPDGWKHAHSVREALDWLEQNGPVTHASLDHDLGDYAGDGGDGTALTDWFAEHGTWPTGGLRVHSSNPVGVATMLATSDRFAPYTTRIGAARGRPPAGGWPPISQETP